VNDHLFEKTGVEHKISAAYHPQTNGLDERFNQTLVNILIKMSGEQPEEWDEFIDAALFAYRLVYAIQ
jgi:transposase InsO family protein